MDQPFLIITLTLTEDGVLMTRNRADLIQVPDKPGWRIRAAMICEIAAKAMDEITNPHCAEDLGTEVQTELVVEEPVEPISVEEIPEFPEFIEEGNDG